MKLQVQSRLGLVLIMLGVMYLSSFETKVAYSATNTPTAVKPSALRIFPRDLYCDEIKEVGDGPTWETVTIGKTTITELETYLNAIDNYQTGTLDDGTFFFRPEKSDGPKLGVVGCTVNGIITALAPSTSEYHYITDIIVAHGLPDAVTWTSNPPVTSVAFWFKQGIAAEVLSGDEYKDGTFFHKVSRIIFFPYQDIKGHETRWPYNKTRSANFPVQGMGTPEGKQNPFDFEDLVMTITAQPSRTPTTTFQPRPTKTPTAATEEATHP
jgi:hypothetical protein